MTLWWRLSDSARVTVHGLLGDQILWTYEGDPAPHQSLAVEFMREHVKIIE